MLTISSILFHWLQDKEKRKEKTEFTHPFQNPRFQTELFPKSAQFLDFQWTPTGLSGQFRGILSGLKPLDWRNLLQCDEKQFGHELMLKQALMVKGGGYREKVSAGLDCRLDAQQELLDLVLQNLRLFHGDTFAFTEDGFRIKSVGLTYRISDWQDSPLVLLAQIIQEDFIILEHDELANCWRFVTGVAAFSFVELGINGEKGFMTPGASMASIHTPVPGFNPTIHDQVSNYFKTLKGENAFWRANWIITPLEGISPFETAITGEKGGNEVERSRISSDDQEEKEAALKTAPLLSANHLDRPAEELAVRTEYQTIFKLPNSGCLVFAIHSYIDPLHTLTESPRAAEMIARATEKMNSDTLNYRGVNDRAKETIVTFLRQIYSKN